MKLLCQLPPPPMPTPISFDQWKENALENCKKCKNTRTQKCTFCHGTGEVECCECGNDKECDECSGSGNTTCKCSKNATHKDYVERIAYDYNNLLHRKNLVMPETEIKKIAEINARYYQ